MSSYSKKILKKLAEKPAMPVKEVTTPARNANVAGGPEPLLHKEGRYAISRSLKNLVEAGYAELRSSDNQKYVKITQKGKSRLNTMLLEGDDALVPQTWDGFWRIIILDIPEERKSEREALRYLLKKANFVCIKNTVWISPFPYEHLFTNIKKDLGFSTELMIIVTDKLDEDTHLAFLEAVKN
jgi:DNA-binding transcriptional regulator PaaX